MSEIKLSSESNSLISELKSIIESRKNTLNHYKKIINDSDPNSIHISINRSDYNYLLEDFEYTIIQSLQAIISLEAENLNYREIIQEFRKENAINNRYRNPFEKETKHLTHTDHEEFFRNNPTPSASTTYNYNPCMEKYPEMTFSHEFSEKENAQYLNDKNGNVHKLKIFYEYDIDSPTVTMANKIASCSDEQNQECIRNKRNFYYQHEVSKEQTTIDSERSKNLNLSEEYKLNFDYSKIKDYDKFLTISSDMKKIEYDNQIQNDIRYENYDTVNKEEDKNCKINNEYTPAVYDQKNLKNDNQNLNENSSLNIKDIKENHDVYRNFLDKEISIKEGLRNKIKNKANSIKNDLEPVKIFESNYIKQQTEEDGIQLINKKNLPLVKNILDHKNKISNINYVDKINRDEKLIEYFACVYGDGNYQEFLKRLNERQLNNEEIEKITNYFNDLKNSSRKFQSTDSNRSNNKNVSDQILIRSRSNRNFKNLQNESIDSRNSRRNNSSQKEFKSDVYIEPIRLENYLRSDKHNNNRNRVHSNKIIPINQSNDNQKNETLQIPRKAYNFIEQI